MKGLQRIQTSLLGIGVLGIAQFARLDDAMARTLAHMREFDSDSPVKAMFQKGVLGMSAGTRTGAADLAHGLDVLASSGMNAAMAMENLATAENFSVASGMPMQKATRRLVDLMNGLGLAVDNTEDHYNNMRQLSDMIVGLASKSGSTEEQLSEAFSGRFINSMKTAKLDVQDAISLLATYSKFGESTRGAAAGTRLSRGLESMMLQVTSHGPVWSKLLGGDTVSEQGRLMVPGIQLIERLSKALDGLDPQRRDAEFIRLGFNTEGIAAIEPILRHFPTVKLMREEIEKTGNISEKTAAMIRSSLLGQLTTLFNAASAVATVFGERLAPIVHGLTMGISALAQAFIQLAPWYQNLIIYGSLAFVVFRNFNLVMGLTAFVLSPLTMALRGVVGAFSLLYDTMTLLVSLPFTIMNGFRSLFSIIVSGARMAFAPLMMLLGIFGQIWGSLVNIGTAAAKTLFMFGEAAAAVGIALGKTVALFFLNTMAGLFGLLTTLVSVIAALVLIGPLIGLMGTVFAAGLAASAAIMVTVGTALVSLASIIGGALVAAWGAFQVAATAALVWVGKAVSNIQDNIAGMWSDLQKGTGQFIQTAAASLKVIAGFFWNFRENVNAIWKWFGKYGERAFMDIADAGFKFMNILAGNIGLLAGAIGTTLYKSLTAAWMAFMDYVTAFGDWFGKQWPNIIGDIGRIMGALFSGFKENFAALFDLIGKMVGTVVEQIQVGIWNASGNYTNAQIARAVPDIKKAVHERYRTDPDFSYKDYITYSKATFAAFQNMKPEQKQGLIGKSDAEYFQKQRLDAIGDFGNFKAANVDLAKIPFQTDTRGMFNMAEGAGGGRFGGLGDSIKSAFGGALEKMSPLAGAFAEFSKSPIWHELLGKVNVGLPADAGKQMLAAFNRSMLPTLPNEGDMGLSPPKGGGPGFKFEQISLERTMIGGPVAEGLEYQKLNSLKSLDNKATTIINLMNQNQQEDKQLPPKPPTVGRR